MADNTQTIFDRALSLVDDGQEYAHTAISKALDEIQKVLDIANNTSFDNINGDLSTSFNWGNIPALPLKRSDLPNMNADNFQQINPYKEDFIEIFNMIMNKYFDDLLSFHYAEKELEKIFSKGYFIESNIRQQIINRARDDINFEKTKSLETTMHEFSNRGFKNVSGFMLNQLQEIEKQSNNKISQVNRDYVIKETELYTEMYKIAIQLSLDLLPKCVELASNFTSKYGMVYNFGTENTKVYLQGLELLEKSIDREESAVQNRSKIAINESQFARTFNLDKVWKKSQYEIQKVDFKTRLVTNSIEMYTRIGTAGLQSQQSIVQLSSAGISTINSSSASA